MALLQTVGSLGASEAASTLWAHAQGVECRTGPFRCTLCGGPSTEDRPIHVVDRPTPKQIEAGAWPGLSEAMRMDRRGQKGTHVCDACFAAMSEHVPRVMLVDGTTREDQRARNYSWIVTAKEALAATKGHKAELRAACLDPPKPPYVLALTDSGQRHLLPFAAVCHGGVGRAVVQFDDDVVLYSPPDLGEMIERLDQMVPIVGKKSLANGLDTRAVIRLADALGGEEAATLAAWWEGERGSPLGRLGLWLAASQEAE